MKKNHLLLLTVILFFLVGFSYRETGKLLQGVGIEYFQVSDPVKVWVDQQKGSDQNPGTTEKPVKTISKGIELCQRDGELAITSGTYDLHSTIILTKNITIVGGYQGRESSPLKTRIQGFSGGSLFTLKNVTVSFKNLELSGKKANSNEYSNAVLNVVGGKATFENVKIMAPEGIAGKKGKKGKAGVAGRTGAAGKKKSGGSGASGDDNNYGGGGGWSQTNQKSTKWGFVCQIWGGVSNGYSGGSGDTRDYASGGKAFGRDDYQAFPPGKQAGKNGTSGTAGACGSTKASRVKGTYQHFGKPKSDLKLSNLNNFNQGADGTNGGGGGGGGQGQSGVNVSSCSSSRSYPGGGGGGGGSGGMGGKGGEAGQLGVSSIAIYAENTELNFVSKVNILTNNAGNGGAGGDGGTRGAGGTGGVGGSGAYGNGGQGGFGGAGGHGCGGSGGNGGSSIGILMKNSNTTISGTPIYSIGKAGNRGNGGIAASCAISGENGINGLSENTYKLNR